MTNIRLPQCMLVSLMLASGNLLAAQADPIPVPSTPLSDSQRIDSLIRQNQVLLEEIQRLRAEGARPKTREEAFAACMQAAKGQSPMAAESIGGHCDLLLKN